MSSFVISGGRRLFGTVRVSGSKNAALPILFAGIITEGVSIIRNVPDINDVNITLQILEDFGAVVARDGSTVTLDTRRLNYTEPRRELVERIRASSYLLGACSSRFGRARIMPFGGCNFDLRPIDMHISAMRRLGVRVSELDCYTDGLYGADIVFDKISVGATVNALLLTATAKGTSRIFGYAREPHVYSLIDYLCSAGADITVHPDYIEVEGRELHGGTAEVIPDMIEAGTYMIASLATGSSVTVSGIRREHLGMPIELLSSSGTGFSFSDGNITPFGEVCEYVNLYTSPYPGFPTDLQPQTAPLLALSCGGRITEGVWQGRFGYLKELEKFGLKYSLRDGSAEIYPSSLHSARAKSPDLRGGAALVIAALAAEGESLVDGAETVGRGYENIVKKLRSIGAKIEEIQEP